MRWNYSSIVPIWVNECSVFWDAAMKLPAPSRCWLLRTWWRHQMETFSALLALCAGNSPVPVNSPHKGQWHGALMFSFICVWINDWVNNREAGDLRRQHGHYDVNVMKAGAMACKYFPYYWPFVMEVQRSLLNSPHKRYGSVMFSLWNKLLNNQAAWVVKCDAQTLMRRNVYGPGHETAAVLLPGFAINW